MQYAYRYHRILMHTIIFRVQYSLSRHKMNIQYFGGIYKSDKQHKMNFSLVGQLFYKKRSLFYLH